MFILNMAEVVFFYPWLCMMSLMMGIPNKAISGTEAPPTFCLSISMRASQSGKCWLKRRRR